MSDSQKRILEVLSFRVDQEQDSYRLDQFLALSYPDFSRSYHQRLIEEGYVLLDEKKINKPSRRLRAGQNVILHVPEPEPLHVLPEDIPINVLYEDELLVVVFKPCGMVVHPSPGYTSGTLVNALLYRIGNLSSIGGVERPGIVHRLDRNTMGVMVVAKNDFSHRHLSEQFRERRVEKFYRAIVKGLPPWDYRLIELPIGRHSVDRKRFSVKEDGKSAISEVWVLKRFLRQEVSLLRVKIHTGRTHQIRVHLSSLGYPILGDTTYGFKRNSVDRRVVEIMGDCHMLLSHRLAFEHPATGNLLRFDVEDREPFRSTLSLIEQLEE